jgi:putative salt-induced outer membrane protein YdiY
VVVMREGEEGLGRARGPIPLAGLRYVNPPPELSGVGTAYQGRFTLSSAWVRGNSESSTSLVEAAVEARALRYRWEAGLAAKQAEEAGVETASSWLARANYDRFIAPKRFLYGRGSVERDRFSGMDLRTTIGAGYGFQLREDETTRLALRGGIEAVVAEPVDGPRDEHPAFGWGVQFSRKVLDLRAEVFHEQEGYWSLEDTGDVTLRTRTGLRVPLVEGLNATAQLNVDWEKQPEPGREATDATMLLGVGYDW